MLHNAFVSESFSLYIQYEYLPLAIASFTLFGGGGGGFVEDNGPASCINFTIPATVFVVG